MRQLSCLLLVAAWIGRDSPAQSIRISADDEITKSSAVAKAHPTDAAWSRVGDAFMQKARETADASAYARAESAYRQALILNPRYANALAGMAWVSSSRHEFETSIEWARKTLAVDAGRVEAHGLLGDAAAEMGNYDQAFEHYQKMLDLRPDVASYSRGSRILYLTGDMKKAMFLMQKALGAGATYPEHIAWCTAQMALLEFAQGAYLPATQLLTGALQKHPTNYQLLAAMGKLKAAMKDYPAAIDFYRQAQAIVPQHEVAVALGDLYALRGKTEDANRQFALVDTIYKLNVANKVVGDLQMALFLADHDLDLPLALRLAEAEYRTRPTVYAADALAWCYFKSGNFAEAKKYILKAVRLHTPEAIFAYHQGAILAKTGDLAGARKALYQSLSQNPNFDPRAAPAAVKLLQDLGEQQSPGPN